MAYRENFLFFNEGTDAANATGDGAVYKSSDFLGAVMTDDQDILLSFKSRNGALTDDTVAIVLASTAIVRDYMKTLASALTRTTGGMLVCHSDFVGNNNGTSDNGPGKGLDHIYPHVTSATITTAA